MWVLLWRGRHQPTKFRVVATTCWLEQWLGRPLDSWDVGSESTSIMLSPGYTISPLNLHWPVIRKSVIRSTPWHFWSDVFCTSLRWGSFTNPPNINLRCSSIQKLFNKIAPVFNQKARTTRPPNMYFMGVSIWKLLVKRLCQAVLLFYYNARACLFILHCKCF